MVQCEIKFKQTPQSVFYSGSIVNGTAVIILEKPLNVRGISLIFDGRAEVTFNITEGIMEDRERTTYRDQDIYVHRTHYLIGSPKGDTITIDKGVHTFKFSCKLPPELPSSVEGKYGYIRYTTKVVFERPWKFDKTFSVPLTVIKLTDLNNEDPSLRLPSTLQIQKTFCCWPCASKPLILEASTPQTGYVSGQTIPVTVNLYNESGRKIEKVSVTLKKIINFKSSYPSGTSTFETITVAKNLLTYIKNVSKESMDTYILIPAVSPSTPANICRIIQVYYELRIRAFISEPHLTLTSVTIPIFIGNIPLNNYQNQSFKIGNSSSVQFENLTGPISELAPPTYAEAEYNKIDLNKNEKHPIPESY